MSHPHTPAQPSGQNNDRNNSAHADAHHPSNTTANAHHPGNATANSHHPSNTTANAHHPDNATTDAHHPGNNSTHPPAHAPGHDNSDVWLIIPCYNEGSVIGDVIRNALDTFPNIVAVNDGSADNSAHAIHTAGAHLVNHPVNLGQGAALQTGVEYARAQPGARYFVTFDADGQHQVKDVVRMLERLRNEDLDIITGTRFGGQDNSQVPWIKRFVLKTVVLLSPTTRKLGLSDAHNGLRVFNKRVAEDLNLRMNGMSHASEFVKAMVNYGWRVSEEPVDILYTEYSMSKGQSLLNGVNIVADGFIARKLP